MTTKHNAMLVLESLENAGFKAFLAGGCVRDLLLNVAVHDFDVATSATPTEVATLFPDTKFVGANFGVSLVKFNGDEFEVATFRTEGAYSDNRRPDSVKFTTDEHEDVKRRDLTMNALLMDQHGNVHDFVGGVADLKNGVLRAVGNAEERFAEDSLRMLRAVRFAARFNMTMDDDLHFAVVKLASTVANLPADRLRDELVKMLTGGNVHVALELFRVTGLLPVVLPELVAMRGCDQNPEFHPEGDVWNHTLKMLSFLPVGCSHTLALAVLLHDVAKPATAKRDAKTGQNRFLTHEKVGAEMAATMLRNLRFSNEDVEAVENHVAQHMMFFNVSKMSVAKLKRFVRQEKFNELLELHRLDSLGSNGDLSDHEFATTFVANLSEDELKPARLLTGNDLMAMGLQPGPLFRTLLEALETAQLENTVSTREEAETFVTTLVGKSK